MKRNTFWAAASRVLAVVVGTTVIIAAAQSAQAQTYTVLHSFAGPDGATPYAGLFRDGQGNLYGTTWAGGAFGYGTVFQLGATGDEQVLYSFTGGADGANPYASLIRDAAGNLYGTTYYGGDLSCNSPNGCGTVFKVDTFGTESVLYSFTGGADGAYPYAGLVRDATGNLYGTTYYGGDLTCNSPNGCGTVFQVHPIGTENVLYSFKGTDGANPTAGLVRDAAGNLYGTTFYGGYYGDTSNYCHSTGCGTVFKVSSTGKETVLYRFKGNGTRLKPQLDGYGPWGGLIVDRAGSFYGTTLAGGLFDCFGQGGTGAGTIFRLKQTTSGTQYTVLYKLSWYDSACWSYAGLARDSAGDLYGTYIGGWGGVFKLDAASSFSQWHEYADCSDGCEPYDGMVLDKAGNLYGTSASGGTYGEGVVFKIAP